MLKRLHIPALLLGALAAIAGCIRDERATGPVILPPAVNVDMGFEYTQNPTGENKITEIGGVQLYIFNEDGVLIATEQVGAEALAQGRVGIELGEGTYTFVAFGGSEGGTVEGGFKAVQLIDPEAHTFADVAVGETTLDDFRFMLLHDQDSNTPAVADFEDLYFAIARDVQIQEGVAPEVPFDFIREVSTLNVRVVGIQYLPDGTRLASTVRADQSPLEIYATGKMSTYTYDGQIGPYSRELRYDSAPHTIENDALTTSVKLLRLDIDRHAEEPVLLHVINRATGEYLTKPVDVVRSILLNENVNTQEDIDRTESFLFDLEIDRPDGEDPTLEVTIIVDGYEIKPIVPVDPVITGSK